MTPVTTGSGQFEGCCASTRSVCRIARPCSVGSQRSRVAPNASLPANEDPSSQRGMVRVEALADEALSGAAHGTRRHDLLAGGVTVDRRQFRENIPGDQSLQECGPAVRSLARSCTAPSSSPGTVDKERSSSASTGVNDSAESQRDLSTRRWAIGASLSDPYMWSSADAQICSGLAAGLSSRWTATPWRRR